MAKVLVEKHLECRCEIQLRELSRLLRRMDHGRKEDSVFGKQLIEAGRILCANQTMPGV
jgi:hypothetical protein